MLWQNVKRLLQSLVIRAMSTELLHVYAVLNPLQKRHDALNQEVAALALELREDKAGRRKRLQDLEKGLRDLGQLFQDATPRALQSLYDNLDHRLKQVEQHRPPDNVRLGQLTTIASSQKQQIESLARELERLRNAVDVLKQDSASQSRALEVLDERLTDLDPSSEHQRRNAAQLELLRKSDLPHHGHESLFQTEVFDEPVSAGLVSARLKLEASVGRSVFLDPSEAAEVLAALRGLKSLNARLESLKGLNSGTSS